MTKEEILIVIKNNPYDEQMKEKLQEWIKFAYDKGFEAGGQ